MSTAEGYITDVAYIPGFYPNMSPVAMRYVAAINRVAPPAAGKHFRYLEHRLRPRPLLHTRSPPPTRPANSSAWT